MTENRNYGVKIKEDIWKEIMKENAERNVEILKEKESKRLQIASGELEWND